MGKNYEFNPDRSMRWPTEHSWQLELQAWWKSKEVMKCSLIAAWRKREEFNFSVLKRYSSFECEDTWREKADKYIPALLSLSSSLHGSVYAFCCYLRLLCSVGVDQCLPLLLSAEAISSDEIVQTVSQMPKHSSTRIPTHTHNK